MTNPSQPTHSIPAGRPISRRVFAAGALSAAMAAVLSACGADAATPAGSTTAPLPTTGARSSGSATGSSTEVSSSAPVSTSGSRPVLANGVFPVTIEHKLGTTTIDSVPQRVVTVGLTDQDFVLALGVIPVGVTDWYGDQPNAIWPWARDALGSAPAPKMLTNADGIQFGEVAKLKPDLIIGMNISLTPAEYDKLSKIAPTVTAPAGATSEYFDSWRSYLPGISAAVGRSTTGAELEKTLTEQFATVVAAHPQWAGKKAILLQNAPYDGNFYAYPKGVGTEFLTDLGFDVPASLDPFVPAEGGQALVPVERIKVLDAGEYLIWATEKDDDKVALEKVAGFKSLTAVKEEKSVYTGGILAGAIYFSTPLSLPYVLRELVPLLTAAQ
jgi:iron complex transport system substrate-binding protein